MTGADFKPLLLIKTHAPIFGELPIILRTETETFSNCIAFLGGVYARAPGIFADTLAARLSASQKAIEGAMLYH